MNHPKMKHSHTPSLLKRHCSIKNDVIYKSTKSPRHTHPHQLHSSVIIHSPRLPREIRLHSSSSTTQAATTSQSVDERYRLFLDEWDKGFMNHEQEPDGYYADVTYGSIPSDLEGTYFRNGPGNFQIGNNNIAHPYDGDGLIASLAIKDGRAYFRSRYIQTQEYKKESEANQILFRGTFATQRTLNGPLSNIMDLYVKNTSNTNVICYADRLMTFFEAGLPHAVDPLTLETVGIEQLNGWLSLGLPFDLGSSDSNEVMGSMVKLAQKFALLQYNNNNTNGNSTDSSIDQLLPDEFVVAGGDAFTAHPHIDPSTGHLHAFKYQMKPSFAVSSESTTTIDTTNTTNTINTNTTTNTSASSFINTELVFMEIDHSGTVISSQTYTIPGFAFLHDFLLTDDYYIICQNPVRVDNVPYIFGQSPAASCVRFVEGVPMKVHLIPRKNSNNSNSSNGNSNSNGNGSSTSTAVDINKQIYVFDAPPYFVFHHANAYQYTTTTTNNSNDDMCVVIDSIYYDSLPAVGREALASQHIDPDAAFTSRLRRLEINLTTGVMKINTAFDKYLEMPAINNSFFGRKHRYVYGYHSIFEDPQIAVAKIDMEKESANIWKPGKNQFILEPKFVPRKKKEYSSSTNSGAEVEDDGYLVAQLFHSSENRSEIIILDAQKIEDGPVAQIALKEPLPSALHGCWSDVYYGPI